MVSDGCCDEAVAERWRSGSGEDPEGWRGREINGPGSGREGAGEGGDEIEGKFVEEA